MIRALGKNVRIRPEEALTKHDFLLPLTDLLLDMVERDVDSEHALWYSQRACASPMMFLTWRPWRESYSGTPVLHR